MKRIFILFIWVVLTHVCYSKEHFRADDLAWRIDPNDGVAYKVKIIGGIDLHLINNSSDRTISFTGNKEDLHNVTVDKIGDLIIVSKPKTYNAAAPIYLIVNTRNLHSIKYKGITTVYSDTAKKEDLKEDPREMLSGSIRASELAKLHTPAPSDTVIHKLEINGDLDLHLIHSDTDPTIAFTGNSEDLNNVEVDKKGDLVIIDKPKDYNTIATVYLIVNTKNLDSIKYKGSSTVRSNTVKAIDLELDSDDMVNIIGAINIRKLNLHGSGRFYFNKLNSEELQLTIQDSAFAIIEGQVRLTKLEMSDCAWVKVFWNDSEYLKVIGKDQAFAQVAGRVSTLDVDVNEAAHFNGQFLRSKIVYARTYDNARADVYAESIRNALSQDESNIYTYNESKIRFDNMISSGSVMERSVL